MSRANPLDNLELLIDGQVAIGIIRRHRVVMAEVLADGLFSVVLGGSSGGLVWVN